MSRGSTGSCSDASPESPAVYANNVGKPLAAVAIAIARSAEFATKVQHQALRDIAAACELQFPDEPADPNWLEEFTRIVNFHRLRWPAVLRQLDRMRRQRNDPATLGAALRCDGWPPHR